MSEETQIILPDKIPAGYILLPEVNIENGWRQSPTLIKKSAVIAIQWSPAWRQMHYYPSAYLKTEPTFTDWPERCTVTLSDDTKLLVLRSFADVIAWIREPPLHD